MKVIPQKLLPCLVGAIACLIVSGCKTHSTVLPLSGGYEEVSHPYHTLVDEPPAPRASFQHRNADGSATEIWPSLYGVAEVIHGDLAIFVGDTGTGAGETHPRLFAVRSPELPLDITDEVMGRWSKAHQKNAREAINRMELITPTQTGAGLDLAIEFSLPDEWAGRSSWPPQSSFSLDWGQVDEIMAAVRSHGVPEKDPRWHTPYLGERLN
jgi:hypothetical protein